MPEEEDIASLYSSMDDDIVIFPCIEIMALSKLPRDVASEGYIRFYEAFSRRYGSSFSHYKLNDSTKWKKFQPKDHSKFPSWFSDQRSLAAPLLGIEIHTSKLANAPQPPLFESFFEHAYPEYPRNMLRIVLPTRLSPNGPSDLLGFIDEAMADFPVHWGTAGYAFYWNDADSKIERYAERELGGRLVRHPGLATGDFMTWGSGVEDGVANIGWLTFVGDALIDELGGRDALSTAIRGTGIGLRSYRRGVALQAGPHPELGDVNRRDLLPLYHEVGRLLEPVFAPDDVLEKIHVVGLRDPDQRLAWLRRFLP